MGHADIVSDGYAPFRAVVQQWTTLSEAQEEALAKIFTPRTFEAGAHVALPGTGAHAVLFVAQGLLRFYYAAEDGAEANKAFVGEGDFAGPLVAAARGLPLDYGVQALEDTALLAAPYPAFMALVEQEAAFERLHRKLMERLLMHKEIRTQSLLQQSAAERYRVFCEAHPGFVQRVPQYHIASYLGITDVHLSRVRRALVEAS